MSDGVVIASVENKLSELMRVVHRRTDRMFAVIMALQWAAAVLLAAVVTPHAWHDAGWWGCPHVGVAFGVGGLLAVPPILMAVLMPGRPETRFTVSVCQMLYSGFLIHLTGGRIETHFHAFGSLALLAFYRDWRVLVPATVVIAVDNVVRGVYWPESVYGTTGSELGRALEHIGWILVEDVILAISCINGVRERREIAKVQVESQQTFERTEGMVRERTAELERVQAEIDRERTVLASIVSNIPFAVFWKNRELRYAGCNENFARSANLAKCEEVVGRSDYELPWGNENSATDWEEDLDILSSGREIHNVERERKMQDGTTSTQMMSKVPLRDKGGKINGVLGISSDITERKRLEAQLAQAQKLESIGQLAAGIAHEINTPVQYISDNMRFLKDQFNPMLSVLTELLQLRAGMKSGGGPEELAKAAALEQTIGDLDIDFVRAEIPLALDQSLDGLERVSVIVRAMKDFSHPSSSRKEPAELNKAIASTVTICTARWKYVAEVELALDAALPPVPCLLAEFNQVMLNLIVNAADAIGSWNKATGKRGRIRVSTAKSGDWVEIRVSDNGGGIPEDVQSKIFTPFFTTKPVGQGTGQGLAISRNVVVARHGGTLEFETEPGVGTTFVIRLPLVEHVAAASEAGAQREAA